MMLSCAVCFVAMVSDHQETWLTAEMTGSTSGAGQVCGESRRQMRQQPSQLDTVVVPLEMNERGGIFVTASVLVWTHPKCF